MNDYRNECSSAGNNVMKATQPDPSAQPRLSTIKESLDLLRNLVGESYSVERSSEILLENLNPITDDGSPMCGDEKAVDPSNYSIVKQIDIITQDLNERFGKINNNIGRANEIIG